MRSREGLRPRRHSTLQVIALAAALEIVELQEPVGVALDLFGVDVLGGAPRDPEVLVEATCPGMEGGRSGHNSCALIRAQARHIINSGISS